MGANSEITLTAQQARFLRLKAQGLFPGYEAGSAIDAVQCVVGIQAQDLPAAELSVRVRTKEVTAAEVDAARNKKGGIVWTWALRGTLHLLTAGDARWLIPLLGPGLIRADGGRLRQLGWDDSAVDIGMRLVKNTLEEQGSLTRGEVKALFQTNGLPHEGQAPIHWLYRAVMEGAILYGPDREKEPAWVLAEEWLGAYEPKPRPEAIAELARRYLAAYGPAAPEDLAAWSGIKVSEARQGFETIKDQLARVKGDLSAWMLRSHLERLDDPAPQEAVARLLPRFDTYLLGYARRNLAVDPAFARKVNAGGGMISAVVLVDGKAVGIWKTNRKKSSIEVTIEPFETLPKQVIPAIENEIADLSRFLKEAVVLNPNFR